MTRALLASYRGIFQSPVCGYAQITLGRAPQIPGSVDVYDPLERASPVHGGSRITFSVNTKDVNDQDGHLSQSIVSYPKGRKSAYPEKGLHHSLVRV